MSQRIATEKVIVASSIITPGYFPTVTSYVNQRNFSDATCRKVFEWLLSRADASKMGNEVFLTTLKKETGLSGKEISKLLLCGVSPSALTWHCLNLLELCFREEAARILRTNREEVLKPLAPIERDVLDTGNDVWRMVTAAANYCYDVGMEAIGDQLTELLEQMNQRAQGVKIRNQIEFHILSLREAINQHPHLLESYYEDLKSLHP